jgi:hypothetical protein
VSMEVNPPTPHVIPREISSTPTPEPPPLPPKKSSFESKRSTRDPSPGGQRQTEKFKLVRSSSGNVYASSETIRAAGEQWEVIEHRPSSRDRESSRKDRDQRREDKARQKAETEPESDPRNSRSSHRSKQHAVEPLNTQKPLPRTNSGESRRLSSPSKRREEAGDRKRNLEKPQPAPPAIAGPSSVKPLERKPSTSTRPISEVPSSAQLNALGAREAWEMDRLWKAKTMYGAEPNGAAAPAAQLVSPNGILDPGHGSSHTSYVVQNTFQSSPPGSHIYHSMPVNPQSFIYAPTSVSTHPSSIRSFPAPYSTPDAMSTLSSSPPSRSLLNNPLPEPPRESTYQPAPIPPTGTAWTKYAEVTQ